MVSRVVHFAAEVRQRVDRTLDANRNGAVNVTDDEFFGGGDTAKGCTPLPGVNESDGGTIPAERASVYVIESAREIAEPLEPLVWLCEGLRIARESVTIIAGYGYSRKTLYAQALALAIASGSRALGVYSTTQAPVLHIDYEQGTRITRERYQRLARAAGVNLAEALLHVVTFPRFKLNDPRAQEVIAEMLEKTKAGLVIIDSFRASVAGIDENSSEIREHIDMVGREVKRVKAAAEFIHHARKPAADGKAGGKYSLRGNGAIFDAPDSVFIFSGEKGEPTVVDHEKDRLIGTELPSFGLDSADVERDGDPRWGLRVVHLEGEQMRESANVKKAAGEDVGRKASVEKLRVYLTGLPNLTWKGSRSNLSKQVGGTNAVTMAALGDLISTGRIVETIKSRTTDALRWVGP